jgi:hypothetical protein
MSTHALQTAAANRVEAQDSATLDILAKALIAGVATILTARISAQAAVVAAVLATLAAEGVKQFVKRRNWGIKRVGFLVAMTLDGQLQSRPRALGQQPGPSNRSHRSRLATQVLRSLPLSPTKEAGAGASSPRGGASARADASLRRRSVLSARGASRPGARPRSVRPAAQPRALGSASGSARPGRRRAVPGPPS